MAFPVHVVAFRKGDHVCLFYRNLQEMVTTAAPYATLGLRRGERCFCVLPEKHARLVQDGLREDGVDVEKEIERGALVFVSPEETYLKDGTFDSRRMSRLLESAVAEAVLQGFEGFRAMGDLGWAVEHGCCSQLPEYEAMMADFYPLRPATGLCMYDTRAFDASQLRELMKLHSTAVSTLDDSRRSIRLRNGRGTAFGDVIFDRSHPALFHYTVQAGDSAQLLASGQEQSLTLAIDSVKSLLRRH